MADFYDDETVPLDSTIPEPVSPNQIKRKPLPKRTGSGFFDKPPWEGGAQQDSGGSGFFDKPPWESDISSATEQKTAEPTGPAPEGVLPSVLRATVPKIMPGLMSYVGSVAG